MSDSKNPFDYPLNPQFGEGVFRRKIILDAQAGKVYGALEDCNHGFTVSISHQEGVITKVDAQHRRIPFSTCHGAGEPLQQLLGQRIDETAKSLIQHMNPQKNCTHWLDLAIWAVRQAGRGEGVREYLIEVPDEEASPTRVKLWRNDELVIDWLVNDWIVVTPGPYQNCALWRGFTAWAGKIEDADEQEAAFVLQKAYFVSRARRYDIDALAGERANEHDMMRGACFTYSEPNVDVATRTAGTLRDFTNTPEDLLRFK